MSQVAADESDFINKQTNQIYQKMLIDNSEEQITLKLKEFNGQDKVIKNRIILLAVKQLMGSTQRIEKIHLEDIIKLCDNNVGNKYLTPNKNIKFLVKDKKLYIRRNI